jgi:DNA-binding GntR family transcriptional regulator
MARRPGVALEVYRSIKEKICELELEPGEPLIEGKLAEELSTSRTPVREALLKLASEGLVTLIPGKGAFVTPIRLQDLDEVFTVREALEGIAARKAATRVPDEVLNTLRTRFEEMAEMVRQPGNKDAVDEIHDVILTFGGNNLIRDILKGLQGPIRRLQNYAIVLHGREEQSFYEHRSIFEALENRDPAAAESRMREHLESTKESLAESWVVDVGDRNEMWQRLTNHGE